MPIEPSSNYISDQIEYLWRLKSSITRSDIVAVIVSLLESPLENLERWVKILFTCIVSFGCLAIQENLWYLLDKDI